MPKREAILKSKRNKKRLAHVLSTFNVGENVTMDSLNNSVFEHDEADVTMISYVLEAANHVIQVVSDDTDVFILLVHWVYKASILSKVQMERWMG